MTVPTFPPEAIAAMSPAERAAWESTLPPIVWPILSTTPGPWAQPEPTQARPDDAD